MSAYLAVLISRLTNERNQWYNSAISWQNHSKSLEAQLIALRAEKAELEKQLASLRESAIYFKESLHPTIRAKALPHLENGHYDDAIRNAYLALEVAVRTHAMAPDTMVGVELMSYAFAGDDPCIRLATVKTEQEGIHLLFMGAIKSFRNPFGHRFINEKDHACAVELVTLASRLLKMLDGVIGPPMIEAKSVELLLEKES
jgi:uncharacterized protein (TIGR02391 family)